MKSILNSILKDIKQKENINKIKQLCYNRIKNSKINKEDKNKMLHIISKKNTYFEVIKTIYDLILKYVVGSGQVLLPNLLLILCLATLELNLLHIELQTLLHKGMTVDLFLLSEKLDS